MLIEDVRRHSEASAASVHRTTTSGGSSSDDETPQEPLPLERGATRAAAARSAKATAGVAAHRRVARRADVLGWAGRRRS